MTRTNNIQKLLTSPNNYTSLTVFNKTISNSDLIKLHEVLRENTTLTELSLYESHTKDVKILELIKALEGNATLTTLKLGQNKIKDLEITTLIKVLEGNTTLRTLILNENNLGDTGAKLLGEWLEGNATLTSLNLDFNKIGKEGAAAIGNGLKKNTTLATLILQNNKIGEEGATAILQGLRENKSLTKLDLLSNRIKDLDAAVFEELKENTTLTELCLSCDGIRMKGEVAFIKWMNKISVLDFSVNELTDVGATAIGNELKNNTTLTELYLGNNKINDQGAAAIFKGLKNNTTLTILDLGHNNITSKGAMSIVEGLKDNTILTELNLTYNKIGIGGLFKLKKLNIECIDFRFQELSAKQEEIQNYINAIELNKESPEAYNKLGDLFFEGGKYQQAIECFKITKNSLEIKSCLKNWKAQEPKNPSMLIAKGDYYALVGSHKDAQESYHNAYGISKDEELKTKVLYKIANLITNPIELAKHFTNMADTHNHYNFNMVDENFMEMIGETLEEINPN